MNSGLVEAYNDILIPRFNTVRVISVERNGDPCDVKYCALGIMKQDRPEFMNFVFDVLAPELRNRGLDFEGITPYSTEETLKVFPDVWQEIMAEETVSLIRDRIFNTMPEWKNIDREDMPKIDITQEIMDPGYANPDWGNIAPSYNDDFSPAGNPAAKEELDLAA